MAVIVRDKQIVDRLERERKLRFGARGGSLSRTLRELMLEYWAKQDAEKQQATKSVAHAPAA